MKVNDELTSVVGIRIADMNGDDLDDIVRLSNASNLEIEYQSEDGTWTNYVYGDIGSSTEWIMYVGDDQILFLFK